MDKRWVKRAVILAIILVLIVIFNIAGLVTDYWWFKALEFESIFLISLKTKVFLFVLGAVIFYVFAWANLWLASRFHQGLKLSRRIKSLVVFILSLFAGLTLSVSWLIILQYLNQVPFNLSDPIFFKDVSFFVFSLPFLISIVGFTTMVIILTTILVGVDYFQSIIMSNTNLHN